MFSYKEYFIVLLCFQKKLVMDITRIYPSNYAVDFAERKVTKGGSSS